MSEQHKQYRGAFKHETMRPMSASHPAARGLGAILCLAISAIHVVVQGGFPGSQEPPYVGILFYVLEFAGVVTALLLVAGHVRVGWFLSLGVAAGPFVSYMLSRGLGLPGYTDDIGNWAEPLGVVSLVVEAVLLALAITMTNRVLRPRGARVGG